MVTLFPFFFNMNRNTSFSLFPSEVSFSDSSSNGPIWAPVPIVPLRDTPSVFLKRYVDRLYDTYHIPRETFQVLAPSPRVRANDVILANDTIIVFKEQLKAGLRFPLDPFFVEDL